MQEKYRLAFRPFLLDPRDDPLCRGAKAIRMTSKPTGQQTARQCPNCQHINPARALFCNACGAPQPRVVTPEPAPAPPVVDMLPEAAADASPSPPALLEAERRQLTVMFCDLVASTPLAEALDPEALREVMHAYYTTCRDVIQPLAGHIAQYLGDGLLIYFGYPQAHEDDTQRAVRAGLGIISAVDALNSQLEQAHGVRLAMRIGIHTGLVVVGGETQPGAQEPLALGITPNIAARLQDLAAPDTVLMSAASEALVRGYFVTEDLGIKTLSGLSTPLQLYQVLRESPAQNRLQAAAARGLTTFVGRESEIALLRQRWASVQAGQGQVVMIHGEAGIGKSRFVNLVRDEIATGNFILYEGRTSPFYQHSALRPVADLLPRWFGWGRDASPAEKLDRLETRLRHYRQPVDETIPLFAALLAIPLTETRYASSQISAERQRQQLFEAFVSIILEQTEQQPVLFIMEDLHWSDPSTQELLSLLIEQAAATSLMLLLTSRPEFEPPWPFRSHVTPLALNRLPRTQIEHMVDHVTGGVAMPTELIDQLVEKSDGVPLFVEEMTKTVLESGRILETNGRYTWTEPVTSVQIPASLQDSLMARLDRLDRVKSVAQIASVIGRRFSYALLQQITDLDEAKLQRALRRLVAAKLVFQYGVLPQATYTFKHALIQDAAYQSLLKGSRQRYHQRIADALQSRFTAAVETQPELLAHHFTEAGLTATAMPFWLRAGRQAIQRSAYVEAIAHLTRGISLIPSLPAGSERLDHELSLQVTLGSALIAAHGYAAPEVKQAYVRARQLCQDLGETPRSLQALSGLQAFYMMHGELQTARELGEQCYDLAERQRDPVRLLQSGYGLGVTLLFQGELTRAHDLFEAYRKRARPQNYHPQALQDPGVASLTYSALTLWMFGYPDRAMERGQEALHLAQTLDHPYSVILAQFWLAQLHEFRGEWRLTRQLIKANDALTKEYALPFWAAMGDVVRGRIQAELEDAKAGLIQAQQGFDAYCALGTLLGHTRFYEMLATIHQRAGQIPEGLKAIEKALAMVERTGERWNEVNALRRKGDLLLEASHQGRAATRQALAETCLRQAMARAQAQQAKSLELRAAMSLSRLWQQQDKAADARPLLTTIYDWFTEGFDTADLQEARSLLDDLHG